MIFFFSENLKDRFQLMRNFQHWNSIIEKDHRAQYNWKLVNIIEMLYTFSNRCRTFCSQLLISYFHSVTKRFMNPSHSTLVITQYLQINNRYFGSICPAAQIVQWLAHSSGTTREHFQPNCAVKRKCGSKNYLRNQLDLSSFGFITGSALLVLGGNGN